TITVHFVFGEINIIQKYLLQVCNTLWHLLLLVRVYSEPCFTVTLIQKFCHKKSHRIEIKSSCGVKVNMQYSFSCEGIECQWTHLLCMHFSAVILKLLQCPRDGEL